jgi:2-oxoisovalerate dehydrogenase E1 component
MLINVDSIIAAARQVVAGEARAPRRARSGLKRVDPAAPATAANIATTPSAPGTTAAPPPTAPPSADSVGKKPIMPGEPVMMPFGDLTVSEGKLIRWLKKVGDPVSAGEVVVEIETDKAVVEVEAPCAGTMAELLEQEGSMVQMGQQIAVITPAAA